MGNHAGAHESGEVAANALLCYGDSERACQVLIIDDNADLAEAMRRVLSICGFESMTAHTGEHGIELAVRIRPQVVIVDIGLPDMSGFEVARRLHEHIQQCSDMTVIGMSALEPDQHYPAADLGVFDHYLLKPISLDRLLPLLAPRHS